VHRVEVRAAPRRQRVPALVVGGDLLLLVGSSPGLALGAGDDPVDRLLQRGRGDEPAVLRAVSSAASLITLARSAPVKPGVRRRSRPGRCRRRAACPWSARTGSPCGRAGPAGRPRSAVEAAGRSSAGSRMSGPVGRRDQDDATLDVEAVHLDQQLVQRLLALVVAAAETGAAVSSYGVDLVHEDDRRRVRLGLLEQVTHAGTRRRRRTSRRSPNRRSSRTARRPRRRPRGPAASCRCPAAVEQHALGNLRADGLELGRFSGTP